MSQTLNVYVDVEYHPQAWGNSTRVRLSESWNVARGTYPMEIWISEFVDGGMDTSCLVLKEKAPFHDFAYPMFFGSGFPIFKNGRVSLPRKDTLSYMFTPYSSLIFRNSFLCYYVGNWFRQSWYFSPNEAMDTRFVFSIDSAFYFLHSPYSGMADFEKTEYEADSLDFFAVFLRERYQKRMYGDSSFRIQVLSTSEFVEGFCDTCPYWHEYRYPVCRRDFDTAALDALLLGSIGWITENAGWEGRRSLTVVVNDHGFYDDSGKRTGVSTVYGNKQDALVLCDNADYVKILPHELLHIVLPYSDTNTDLRFLAGESFIEYISSFIRGVLAEDTCFAFREKWGALHGRYEALGNPDSLSVFSIEVNSRSLSDPASGTKWIIYDRTSVCIQRYVESKGRKTEEMVMAMIDYLKQAEARKDYTAGFLEETMSQHGFDGLLSYMREHENDLLEAYSVEE